MPLKWKGFKSIIAGANNIIEIEGLLFPGLTAQLKNRFFPSSDVMHMSMLKIFQLKSSILSALMTSLDGKNQFFSWAPAFTQTPGIASRLFE